MVHLQACGGRARPRESDFSGRETLFRKVTIELHTGLKKAVFSGDTSGDTHGLREQSFRGENKENFRKTRTRKEHDRQKKPLEKRETRKKVARGKMEKSGGCTKGERREKMPCNCGTKNPGKVTSADAN